MDNITQLAQQLREARLKLFWELRVLLLFETERDGLQASLIAALKGAGMASVKLESGETYSKSSRKGFEIVNEPHALKWAVENMAVSIDKRIVAQKLKDASEIPECFKVVESEYISIRSSK